MNVYNNTRWRKARLTYLKLNPFCVMCREQGRYEPATAVDHIIPHKLEQVLIAKDQSKIRRAQQLFWDSSNWQGLCNTYHSSTKQRIENRGTEIGCDINGMPYGGQAILLSTVNPLPMMVVLLHVNARQLVDIES